VFKKRTRLQNDDCGKIRWKSALTQLAAEQKGNGKSGIVKEMMMMEKKMMTKMIVMKYQYQTKI